MAVHGFNGSGFSVNEPVRSRISDGFVKRPRSRLANPENTAIAGAEGSVLIVRRSDEG